MKNAPDRGLFSWPRMIVHLVVAGLVIALFVPEPWQQAPTAAKCLDAHLEGRCVANPSFEETPAAEAKEAATAKEPEAAVDREWARMVRALAQPPCTAHGLWWRSDFSGRRTWGNDHRVKPLYSSCDQGEHPDCHYPPARGWTYNKEATSWSGRYVPCNRKGRPLPGEWRITCPPGTISGACLGWTKVSDHEAPGTVFWRWSDTAETVDGHVGAWVGTVDGQVGAGGDSADTADKQVFVRALASTQPGAPTATASGGTTSSTSGLDVEDVGGKARARPWGDTPRCCPASTTNTSAHLSPSDPLLSTGAAR